MNNRTNKFGIIICAAALAASAMLSGCGGSGGGAAAPSASVKPVSATGFGKVSAVVKLTPPAGREVGSTAATVTVSISITGVYAVDGKEFAPVTTSAVIDIASGPAKVSMLNVPVGVNHLITVAADWGGFSSETLKAIIPEVADGELSPVTVDPASTIVADIALFIAARENERLVDLDPKDIAKIEETVASMAANGISYSSMTPELAMTYMSGMGMPASVTVTPASATLAIGQTSQFTGAQLDMNSVAISGATFTWSFLSTASTTVGAVSSTGLFTAAAEGTGILTASSGGFSATALITVISNCTLDAHCDDGQPLTIDACVNPNTNTATCSHTAISKIGIVDAPGGAGNDVVDISLSAGQSSSVYSAAFDANGGYLSDVSATWSVSGVAGSVSPASGASSTFTASTIGTGVVSAVFSGLSDTTGVITVGIGPLASGVISPQISPYATAGSVLQFTFTGADSFGNQADLTAAASWTTTGPLQATANPGEYNTPATGPATIAASYYGFSMTPVSFSVVELPPTIISNGGFTGLGLNQSFSLSFTPVDGASPIAWSLAGGAYPLGTTIDPNTGLVTGVTPSFISKSRFYVRATDSLGRATSNTDPFNITDAEIDLTVDLSRSIQDIENALAVAESGMSSIMSLLQQLRTITLDSIANNTDNTAQCAAMLTQIDSVVSSATFNSATLTNGPVLLDGSYDANPITLDLGGASPMQTFITNILNSSRTSLGILQVGPNNYGTPCAMTNTSIASIGLPQIDGAIATASSNLYHLGVKAEIGNYLLEANNILIQDPATGQCMPDLYSTTGVSDQLLNTITTALNRMRALVAQAGSGTATTAEQVMMQEEVDGITGFLDSIAMAAAFNGNILFDGTLSQTCAGAPTVTNPATLSSTLGVNSFILSNLSDPTPYLNAIDSALASIAVQRANLQGWKSSIGSLLGYLP